MPTITELPRSDDLAAFGDRRRPGRLDMVSPTLLPLLRGEEAVDANQASAAPAIEADDPDNLAAARGIIGGVGFSAAFWLFLGAILGWWF